MKSRLSRFGGIAASLTLLMSLALAQGEPSYKELPRFHQVNAHLFRGAQPNEGGIERLKALGIRTIINLRGEDEGTRDEAEQARRAGLRYFNVPLPDLSRPKDEQVERVLNLVNDRANWPVFVHCNHGKDRTGLIIACYRISQDGWTSEKAKAEAKRYGMSWVQVGMKDYISDYYKRRQEEKSGTQKNN